MAISRLNAAMDSSDGNTGTQQSVGDSFRQHRARPFRGLLISAHRRSESGGSHGGGPYDVRGLADMALGDRVSTSWNRLRALPTVT